MRDSQGIYFYGPEPGGFAPLCTVPQAADMLTAAGFTTAPSTVRKYILEGKLPYSKAGKLTRIRRLDVVALIERKKAERRFSLETLSVKQVAEQLQVSPRWVQRRCRPPYARKLRTGWRIYPWAVKEFIKET